MSSRTPPDPTRSLNLLWGPHTKPSRSGLTVQSIVDTAIALCDSDSLGALSMRRVAERLGIGTMSLYTHIPGKDELTDLMFDSLMGQVYRDVDEPNRQGGWREAMQFVAEQNWRLYTEHPWLTDMVKARPVFGPHVLLKYEAELRPLEGVGLSDVEMDTLLAVIMTHVHGAARIYGQLEQEKQDSAKDDKEWWLDRAPLLENLIDPKRFPVASRVGAAFGEMQVAAAPELAMNFGLARLLDGVGQLLASRKQR